jgi:hypothetical protein
MMDSSRSLREQEIHTVVYLGSFLKTKEADFQYGRLTGLRTIFNGGYSLCQNITFCDQLLSS